MSETSTTAAPDPDYERQRCEIWSRVMGYHRPVSQWNAGKQSEHAERVFFLPPGDGLRQQVEARFGVAV